MKVAHTERSYYAALGNAAYRGVETAGYLANQTILKPLYIGSKASLTTLGATGKALLPAVETALISIMVLYGKDALNHGSTCGALSIFQKAAQGELSSTFKVYWSDKKWGDFLSSPYWQSLYTNITSSNSSALFNSLFITPFQKGSCKDFQADMMIILPCLFVLTTSLTAKIAYPVLKTTLSDIYQNYYLHHQLPASSSTKQSLALTDTQPSSLTIPEEPTPSLAVHKRSEADLLLEIFKELHKK